MRRSRVPVFLLAASSFWSARRWACVLAAVLIYGCDSGGSSYLGPGGVALAEPCLNSPCATKTEHLYLFDAENAVFSDQGRLFISGGEAVYEISRDNAGDLVANVVSGQSCNYTGLTMKGDTLYAACGDNSLFAADIHDFPLRRIYSISNSILANGLTELNGRLYLTDGPISLPSKIIQLDIDPTDDLRISAQRNWTGFGDLISANGIQTVGDEIWVTDFNQLKAFTVGPDGSKGDSRVLLSQGVSTFDDFTVLSNGNIVMNDYLGGTSYIFDPQGRVVDSTTGNAGPSSAVQGRPPWFNASQILITEKGLLGDRTASNGNHLAVFTAN